MSHSIQIENATCRFGDLVAVDEVSFSVETGERLAFIGPSGSGKTTLIRLINSMLIPDGGSVTVLDQKVASLTVRDLRKLRSRVATIPQHLGLVENLTAIQNVILGQGGRRGTFHSLKDLLIPSRADQVKIHSLLNRVGIEDKLFTRVSQLSGGQRQRVAIARALFQEPDVILADEPVSAVDPARARDTVDLLCSLSEEDGFTLCVSLHHLELAREFFPRLIGLRSGGIVLDGASGDLSEAALAELYDLSDEEMMTDA